MPKSPPQKEKDYYASVMFPGSKKLSIVSKRVGTKERLYAIATVTSEMVADRIVEALNLHQGEMEKLEVPAQKLLAEVRDRLVAEQGVSRALQQQITQLKNEKGRLEMERDRAMRERDAAQAKARDALGLSEPTRATM